MTPLFLNFLRTHVLDDFDFNFEEEEFDYDSLD